MADAFDDQADDPFEEFFEDPEQELEPYKPRLSLNPVGCLLNVLSGILVTATLVVGLVFGIIFVNPQSGLNPLPPTTMPVLMLTWTPSPTPRPVLPPTWTPAGPTREPTAINQPTVTPLPAETPIPTANLESGTTFEIQEGYPKYETNLFHPEAGCDWLGIGGALLDTDGEPVLGVLIEAGGSLGGEGISRLTLSGTAKNYGESGYEITLADSPQQSSGEVWIQLLDQANLPLTEKIYLQTFSGCDSNLIRINFVQSPSQ